MKIKAGSFLPEISWEFTRAGREHKQLVRLLNRLLYGIAAGVRADIFRAFVVGLQRVGYLRIVPAGYFDVVIAFIVLKENIVLGTVQIFNSLLFIDRLMFVLG